MVFMKKNCNGMIPGCDGCEYESDPYKGGKRNCRRCARNKPDLFKPKKTRKAKAKDEVVCVHAKKCKTGDCIHRVPHERWITCRKMECLITGKLKMAYCVCAKCGDNGIYGMVRRGNTTCGTICSCPAGKAHPMNKLTNWDEL